jgi:hypothetical protein
MRSPSGEGGSMPNRRFSGALTRGWDSSEILFAIARTKTGAERKEWIRRARLARRTPTERRWYPGQF